MAAAGSSKGIGSRRLVVGAHYGIGGFLAQRVTAIVLAAYTLLLFVLFIFSHESSYVAWAGLFAPVWMKILTVLALFSVFYHAWIGMRDIWMDYIKPAGLRLGLQVLTALWLLFCAIWSVQILWSV